MDELVRESGYIRVDETPVQVLKSDKAPSAEHYMWIRLAGPARQRVILFDYDVSRGAEVAARLLEGAGGYLQTDGYRTYDLVAKPAIAHDGKKTLAILRRRPAEAVADLLLRLDAAIASAQTTGSRVDEINKPSSDVRYEL
jgi:hypothetical protein